MKMNVTCPNCQSSFPLDELLLNDFRVSVKMELENELQLRQQAFLENLEKSRKEIRQSAINESSLKLKEKEKLITDLKSQLQKVRQKLDNSSQQTSGEILEVAIEELLMKTFPFDSVEPIGPGKNGADCVQIVRTQTGIELGRILIEAKRVKNFSNSFIEKLKSDNLRAKCDLMVIITTTLPKDIPGKFGLKDGVWICLYDPDTIKTLCVLLRYSIVKVYEVAKRNGATATEAEGLLNYLQSDECQNLFARIISSFHKVEQSFKTEQAQLTKLWKIREQQLRDMLANALEFYGTMRGISSTMPEIQPLEFKKAS